MCVLSYRYYYLLICISSLSRDSNAEKGLVRDEILLQRTSVIGVSNCCYVDCGTFAT